MSLAATSAAIAAKLPTSSFKVLVIGYGNELRADDGVGCAAANQLERKLQKTGGPLRDHITVMTAHQLLPELSEPLSRCDLAIFIDADAQLRAGEIRRRVLSPVACDTHAIGHQQSPDELLHLAKLLYDRAPAGVIYSIGAASFAYDAGLSPLVRRAIPNVIRQIMAEIKTQAASHA